MDSLDEEEFLDPRVKRTIGILEAWESSHLDEVREQQENAIQAISDSEMCVILDRIIPDGGLAWLLVLTTWISNGITNGVGFSYGLLLSGIVDATKACPPGNGTATPAACPAVSLPMLTAVGTVHSSLVYLTTPLLLLYSNRVHRLTDFAYMGALLTTLGLFLSALIDFRSYSSLLLLHFSFTAGMGLAVQTTLQATILSHYFNKRMSIAAGITSSGNGMFSGLLSICISVLNARLGVRFSFLLLSGLASSGLVFTQFWRANRDFLLLQKWVRTPTPLITELLTARVLHNRRFIVLFLSILCLYSGLLYPWMVLLEYAKVRFTESQMATITYVYTVRGFSNALFRCLVGFVVTSEWVRRRLLYLVPACQALYPIGMATLLAGLESRSLPLMFAAAGITALGESLIIASLPAVIARLTNPADTPAGLMLMNLTFSMASLLPPTGLSLLSASIGNYQPAYAISIGFGALGCLLSLLQIAWMPAAESDGEDGGGGAGGGGGITERYIALDGSVAATTGYRVGDGSSSGGSGSSGTRSGQAKSGADQSRSLTRRAVKHNAYRVTSWRQQECDVAADCFLKKLQPAAGTAVV